MNEARLAAGRTPLAFARMHTRLAVLALALAAAHPVQAQEPADEPITIVGRFLLPDGAPAVGASVKVHGWGANQDRKMKYGVPPNYKDPAVVNTGEDGTFEVSFVPPRAFQFVVDVNLEGYVEAGWRWGELEPGTKKDLGETTLGLAGVLEGSILDAEGNTLIGTWRITAEVRGGRRSDGREAPRAYASPNRETGIFRLEGLPAGKVIVDARDRGHARIAEQAFQVVAGKVTRIALEYEGPSLANQINVTVFSRPFNTFEPEAKSIRLRSPTGEVKEAYHVQGSSQTYRFDDVDPGEYEVEVVDPLFKAWRKTGVRNGENIDARLEGNAGVRLSIVDPTGAPVQRYGLRIVFHRSGSWREFELAKEETAHESVAYFGRLLPMDFILIVRVAGWPPIEIEVEGLEPNETREVTATLTRGLELAGRVVGPDGAPLAGVVVEYTRGKLAGHSLGPSGSMVTADGLLPPKNGDTTTDAEGRFRFPGLASGTWTLRARFSEWLVVDRTLEVPTSDEVVFTSPGGGWLVGWVLIPEGASLEPLDLTAKGASVPPGVRPLQGTAEERAIGEDGSFRIGPIPAGEVWLYLYYEDVREDGSSWSTTGGELGRFDVVAGQETDVVVDLLDTYPGRVLARVRIDGASAPDAEIWPEPPPERERASWSTRRWTESDVVSVRVMVAGDWRFSALPRDASWCWTRPEPVTVPPAGEVELELDVRLAERRVRFLDDATGKPLAERTIVARMGEGRRWSKQEATTDGEGYATFALCDGTVRFQDAKSEEAETTEVEWRVEGDGPGDVRLSVVPD